MERFLIIAGLIVCNYSWLGLVPIVIGVLSIGERMKYNDQRREEKRKLNRRQA